MQVSVRIFANDLESTLKKLEKEPVDLFNPEHTEKVEVILAAYLKAVLKLKVNSKSIPLHYLGYEIDSESCWIYLDSEKCDLPQKIQVENAILYEHLTEQSNIVQIELGDKKKSARQIFPKTAFDFDLTID